MPNRDGSLTFEELLQLFGGGGSSLGGSLMQGITPATPATQQPVPQGVMGSGTDDLNPVNMTSMVGTHNASGTDHLMMAGTDNIGFGGNGISDVQNAVNTQFNANNTNFAGTGEPNMDAVAPTLTQEQMDLYNQMPDHLKQAFIQGIADGSYSPYAMEQQMGY